MKKKLIYLFIGILLVSLVTAGVVILSNKALSTDLKPTRTEGIIAFTVGKEIYNCLIDEPDSNKTDSSFIDFGDIKTCAGSIGISENTELKDIKDWNGNYLQDDGTWKKE